MVFLLGLLVVWGTILNIPNAGEWLLYSYFLAAKYLLSKILERTDWINKELKGASNQQVMRRRASLGCRVAGNDAGVWGAEARK